MREITWQVERLVVRGVSRGVEKAYQRNKMEIFQ